jgi:N-acetylmuramoyl-L-alanine amidase
MFCIFKFKSLLKVLAVLMLMLIFAPFFMKNVKPDVLVSSDALPPCDVIIDAGHGGYDSGAVGITGAIEAELNLAVARKTRDILTAKGVLVLMTRDGDVAIQIDEKKSIGQNKKLETRWRKAVIEASGAKALVSIHMNTFTSSKESGTQVFYATNLETSKAFGELMQEEFKTNLGETRLAKQIPSSVFLMKKPPMNAILIECGFISNKEEEAKLKTEEHQNKLAEIIAGGIMKQLGK